jgi:hypothetical protein
MLLFTVFLMQSCNEEKSGLITPSTDRNDQKEQLEKYKIEEGIDEMTDAEFEKELLASLPKVSYNTDSRKYKGPRLNSNNRSCSFNCTYNLNDCGLLNCYTSPTLYRTIAMGCPVSYTFKYKKCYGPTGDAYFQILDINITNVPAGCNTNIKKAFDFNLIIPGNTPTTQSYFYNLYMYSILYNIINNDIVPIIQNEGITAGPGSIITVLPKSCFALCNGIYKKCSSGCCMRITTYVSVNGYISDLYSENGTGNGVGVCNTPDTNFQCSDPNASCNTTLNCNIRIP